MNICGTTACYPGFKYLDAVASLVSGTCESLIGELSMDHCQLCPQSHGVLTEETIDTLKQVSPTTQFRLHANVRVLSNHVLFDASTVTPSTWPYFTRMAELSRYMGASVYSAHAGRRSNATLEEMRNGIHRLSDLFDHTVAVEGLYPSPGNIWLLSDWADYQWLLESGLSYALDLSHLGIVAHHSHRQEIGLLNELLSSDRCVEVHVSDNAGKNDSHDTLSTQPWWWNVLVDSLSTLSRRAVVFSEGNQLVERRSRQRASPDLHGLHAYA
jgi:hypothetical protein